MNYKKRLTKYECSCIIGLRSNQLSMSAPILTDIDDELKDNFTYVAAKELRDGKLKLKIRRPLPNNKFYEISSEDMILPPDLDDLLNLFREST